MYKELFFRIFAVSIGIVAGLFILELGLRLKENEAHPLESWKAIEVLQIQPYTMWHYTPEVRSKEVNTNHLGYRGQVDLPLYPQDVLPDDNFKVILTGGSAAFGAYAPDDATISTKIEQQLSAQYPTTVINLGMGGYTSFAQFVAVSRYGMMHEPDLIIVMDGFNDIYTVVAPHLRGTPGNPYLFDKLTKATLTYDPTQLKIAEDHRLASVVEYSALLRYLLKVDFVSFDQVEGEDERRSRLSTLSEADTEQIIDFYLYSQSLLISLAQSHHTKVIIATQPLKDYPGDPKEEWRRTLFKVYPRLIEEARFLHNPEQGVYYIDLTQVLPSPNTEYFADNVHLNADGQAKIADFLARFIVRDVVVKNDQ